MCFNTWYLKQDEARASQDVTVGENKVPGFWQGESVTAGLGWQKANRREDKSLKSYAKFSVKCTKN